MPPTFSRGVFRSPNSKPYQALAVANYHGTSRIDYIRSLRPICETFFYLLLVAYTLEFTHTHHDLFPMAKTKDVLERVRLAGRMLRNTHVKPLHLR